MRITDPIASGESATNASVPNPSPSRARRARPRRRARRRRAPSATRTRRGSPESPSAGTTNIGSAPGGYSTRKSRYGTSPSLNRLAVRLVHGRVDDLLPLVEAATCSKRGHDATKSASARATLRRRSASARSRRRARTRRTGRTTGCRGRTSASARAGTRRRARRSAPRAGAATSAAGRTRPQRPRRRRRAPSTWCGTWRSGCPACG